MMNKTTITLIVASYEDRERLVLGLANSGYKVWVQEEYISVAEPNRLNVVFELK